MDKRNDKGQPFGRFDGTFAQLTDMFGDTVPAETISKVGHDNNWHLNNCIEQLIKFDPQTSNAINNGPMSFAQMMKHQLRNSDSIPTKSKQPRTFGKTGGGGASNDIPEPSELSKIIDDINRNLRVMVCMRGAPGSGKSYLARTVIDRTMAGDYSNHIFSTDDYFYDNRTKQYNFKRQLLSQAHDTNQLRVAQRALNGWSPIIVDNTNMKLWEMFAYVSEGVKHGYIIRILEPNTPWSRSVGTLAMKNKHNVDRENISRMLDNYEPGTVRDVFQAMNVRPSMSSQLRNFPEIRDEPPATASFTNCFIPSTSTHSVSGENAAQSQPKEQRFPNRKVVTTSVVPASVPESDINLIKWKEDIEWPAFEDEQEQFWNSDAVTKPANLLESVPKPQRNETNKNNIFDLLREASNAEQNAEDQVAETLTKHEKDCPHENKSFQQIRIIYPFVPISLLWDLFEKCNGDGDWVMDILLKDEDFTNGVQKLESDDEIARDNFTCDCRTPQMPNLQEAAKVIPVQIRSDTEKPAAAANRLPRRIERMINSTSDSSVRKHLEEQFIIGDEHYTDRLRKVRDFRRGTQATTSVEPPSVDTTAAPIDVEIRVKDMSPIDELNEDIGENGTEDMIEMDLGIQLVCQLDSVFGANAMQSDNLKNIKTNVFLPRSLGQQLYAIWMESLYHQIDEQRKEALKQDEQFAKELQEKQKPLHLFAEPSGASRANNLRDIVDMQYTWTALKADQNEWKQTTPGDLATKLTKAKLFEIFPNIKEETLVEVFAAHGNQFHSTVETLKDSLSTEMGQRIQVESQQLVTQAQEEVQAIKSSPTPHQRSGPSHAIHKIVDKNLNKIDMEEAKRAALHDFEENRNLAMHHSHLKAECFLKAKESFQRRQHGVATYYSNVANLHNSKIDMYNNRAANAIVEVHSYCQPNQDMLDLHYLHAAEAVECLDIFIDKHIKQLKDLSKGVKYVFVITGRGLHSTNGISTIKQRVKNRFRERNLSWMEVNPGLLKAKLQFISPFTHDLRRH